MPRTTAVWLIGGIVALLLAGGIWFAQRPRERTGPVEQITVAAIGQELNLGSVPLGCSHWQL